MNKVSGDVAALALGVPVLDVNRYGGIERHDPHTIRLELSQWDVDPNDWLRAQCEKIPQITFANIANIPGFAEDVNCVAACDNAPESDDEEWWNACIDQCMEQSAHLGPIARRIARGGQ